MSDKDLKDRTKKFAPDVIRLVASLPRSIEADIIEGFIEIISISAFRLPNSREEG